MRGQGTGGMLVHCSSRRNRLQVLNSKQKLTEQQRSRHMVVLPHQHHIMSSANMDIMTGPFMVPSI
jgi:hypothetical protein